MTSFPVYGKLVPLAVKSGPHVPHAKGPLILGGFMKYFMKKCLFLAGLLGILTAGAGAQQAVQVCPVISNGAGNQLTYSTTCKLPSGAGNTIIIPEVGPISSITDTNGDVFQKGVSITQLGFWYTLKGVGGSGLNTITITLTQPGALQALPVEYAGVTGVTVSAIANGSGTAPLSFSLPAAAGNIIVGFGAEWTNSYQGPSAPGTGFAFEGNNPVWLQDLTVTAAGNITSTATYSSPVNWYTGVAVLNTVPPVPNVILAVNSGSTATYDNNTPIMTGTVNVTQQENPTTTVQIGVITSDSSGNLTGSLIVNPNWTDANENLNFIFSIPGIPYAITYPVPVGEFQHGSTGLTINLVLFAAGPLGIHSQTIAVTP